MTRYELKFLYNLHTHPQIRKYFFDKRKFTYKEHLAYWEEKLKQKDFDYKIILYKGKKAGCIRRDKGLISLAILPKYQSKGLGTKAFIDFCKKGDWGELYGDNTRSLHVLMKTGFRAERRTGKNIIVRYKG